MPKQREKFVGENRWDPWLKVGELLVDGQGRLAHVAKVEPSGAGWVVYAEEDGRPGSGPMLGGIDMRFTRAHEPPVRRKPLPTHDQDVIGAFAPLMGAAEAEGGGAVSILTERIEAVQRAATAAPAAKKERQPASPGGVFPEWPKRFFGDGVPMCSCCEGRAPRNGLHLCRDCEEAGTCA